MIKTLIGPSRLCAAVAALAITLFISAAASAQTPSMMWRVSKDGHTGYMLGSIHIGDKKLYPLAPEIESAFDASNRLLVELDIDTPNIAKVAAVIQAKGTYPAGDTIWKHLDAKTADRLKAVLAQYKLPEDGVASFRPWILAIQVGNAALMSKGADFGLGIDKYFLDKARGHKTIEELETPEGQLEIFAGQTDDVQIQFLQATLGGIEKNDTQQSDIEDFWIKGDADGLDRFISKNLTGPIQLERQLREDRNPHMADGLANCMTSGDQCFMVVGTAHLIGKGGVADILRSRGYKVEQVNVSHPTSSPLREPLR